MGIRFSADEIYGIAGQIEHNAAAFYRAGAIYADSAQALRTFNELASWEETHERLFAEMRKGLSEEEKKATAADPQNEADQYLKALADQSIFPLLNDPLKIFGENPAFTDIVEKAIGREKDSIVFYVGMREWVSNRSGKDKIESIILEEMKHIRILVGRLKARSTGA